MLSGTETRLSILSAFCLLVVLSRGMTAECAEPVRPSSDVPIEIGSQLTPEWRLERVEQHAEYLRLWFTGPSGRTGVEVNVHAGGDVPDATSILVQPAPGESPPAEVLAAVREAYRDRDPEELSLSVRQTEAYSEHLPKSAVRRLASVVAGFCVLFAVALFFRSRKRQRKQVRGWPLAILATAGGIVALVFLGQPVFLTLDIARDLAMARDCVELDHCLSGPTTSFGSLRQATLWSRFLGFAWFDLNLGGEGSRLLLLFLEGLGVGLVALAGRSTFGAGRGGIAVVIYLAVLIVVLHPGEFSNHNAVAVFAPLLAFVSIRFFQDGEASHAGLVGCVLALCVESHAACWGLLAPVPFLVLAIGRRPWRSLALSGLSFVTICYWLSPTASVVNAEQVLRVFHPATAALWAACSLPAGLLMRRRLRGYTPTGRARGGLLFVVGAWLIPAAVIVMSGRAIHGVYLLPILPFAVLLVEDGLVVLIDRVTTRATRVRRALRVLFFVTGFGVIVGLAVWNPHQRPEREYWTMGDVEILARRLFEVHGTLPDLVSRLRSQDHRTLVTGLAPFESIRDEISTEQALLVLRLRGEQLPGEPGEGWSFLDLSGGWIAAIHSYESWILLEQVELRYLLEDSASQELVTRGFGHFSQVGTAAFRYVSRAYPTLAPPRPRVPDGPYLVSYRFRLRAVSATESRFVRVGNPVDDGCSWRIVAVDGPTYHGALGTDSVVLQGPIPEGSAIVIERNYHVSGCPEADNYFPPGIIELNPGDPMFAVIDRHRALDEDEGSR